MADLWEVPIWDFKDRDFKTNAGTSPTANNLLYCHIGIQQTAAVATSLSLYIEVKYYTQWYGRKDWLPTVGP